MYNLICSLFHCIRKNLFKKNCFIYNYFQLKYSAYLYHNTVLDGCVILSVCSFAIKTTFPLSNLKTKHIFGILMTLQKFLKLWGAKGAPIFFFRMPPAPRSFKNFRRVMRIPNMFLVLKLDNGKVVSIANEETDIITQPSSTVL